MSNNFHRGAKPSNNKLSLIYISDIMTLQRQAAEKSWERGPGLLGCLNEDV
jgi:hypothetical protein